ncbi:MAG: LysR family transcriptional regulator [Microbacteriaceae bacterium]|nr:LysR family transcriptional regulator [Microbacteriaceae bacterium]HOT34618.1 LysR substrate-binding domain-containing protein [Rhodoglobus sp.]HOY81076.1 LysR substrate-binding domain-containing protein [Rhodoglobus sp.]HPG75003.1 LysR substrate-binding domain-containing protein [Rhodoglobus sp.]HPM51315.1 LysR substrate-binding domain-containing protein [Rhodoglobus sp.]
MFDPVLLRSFVAVAETLSFTQSAHQLSLSQPTVSQHIRKLELAAGRNLVTRDTRSVALTDNGEAMLGFARTILAAQDQAQSYFTGSAMRGRLRFGSADDLALTQLPGILRDFRQLYPQINLELTVSQSPTLLRRLAAGALDLVFIKQDPGSTEGRLVRRDRMVWLGHRSMTLDRDAPVPLIAYQAPSLSRMYAIRSLESVGRMWRITCNVKEVNGVLAAVRAGIGIAVFPQSLIPPDLAQVSANYELPELGDVDFSLLDNPSAPRGPIDALTAAILSRPVHQ